MDLTWYNALNKPAFSPPTWVFGPVWTVLYILMAISGIIIWQKGIKSKNVKHAMKLFFIQLILNLMWSPIFFGLHEIFLSLITIIVMWYFIYKTIKAFGKIDKVAAYLLLPYISWVSVAAILNLSIWLLNM